MSWLNNNNTCPMCRQVIEKNKLSFIIDNKEEKKERTKHDIIKELITYNPKNKFIIFSEWNQSFLEIRKTLESINIDYIEICGTTQTRENKLEKFREGKINVAFLNSKMDSAGINMQETTDIILYHSMSDETRQQIIGRANRIGRIKPLTVHHLVLE
jgi:SNF2 family DNA or RNA helicase